MLTETAGPLADIEDRLAAGEAVEVDPVEIYRAARDAVKITSHIMGLAREREQVAEQTTERTVLNVERADNKEVKALGAKWDRKARKWYAPVGVDLDPLAKWVEEPASPGRDQRMVGRKHQYRDESGVWHDGWGPDDGSQGTSTVNEEGVHVYPYGKAATEAAARLEVDGPPNMDGESRRVLVVGGKPGATDGMNVAHMDGDAAGHAEHWKIGFEENWRGAARHLSRENADTWSVQTTTHNLWGGGETTVYEAGNAD